MIALKVIMVFLSLANAYPDKLPRTSNSVSNRNVQIVKPTTEYQFQPSSTSSFPGLNSQVPQKHSSQNQRGTRIATAHYESQFNISPSFKPSNPQSPPQLNDNRKNKQQVLNSYLTGLVNNDDGSNYFNDEVDTQINGSSGNLENTPPSDSYSYDSQTNSEISGGQNPIRGSSNGDGEGGNLLRPYLPTSPAGSFNQGIHAGSNPQAYLPPPNYAENVSPPRSNLVQGPFNGDISEGGQLQSYLPSFPSGQSNQDTNDESNFQAYSPPPNYSENVSPPRSNSIHTPSNGDIIGGGKLQSYRPPSFSGPSNHDTNDGSNSQTYLPPLTHQENISSGSNSIQGPNYSENVSPPGSNSIHSPSNSDIIGGGKLESYRPPSFSGPSNHDTNDGSNSQTYLPPPAYQENISSTGSNSIQGPFTGDINGGSHLQSYLNSPSGSSNRGTNGNSISQTFESFPTNIAENPSHFDLQPYQTQPNDGNNGNFDSQTYLAPTGDEESPPLLYGTPNNDDKKLQNYLQPTGNEANPVPFNNNPNNGDSDIQAYLPPTENRGNPSLSYEAPDNDDNNLQSYLPPSNNEKNPSFQPLSYQTPINTGKAANRIPLGSSNRGSNGNPSSQRYLPPSGNERNPSFAGSYSYQVPNGGNFDDSSNKNEGCQNPKHVRDAAGICVLPDVIRDLYVYKQAPNQNNEVKGPVPKPKLKLNLLVIKSNNDDENNGPIIVEQEEKTIVLVLKEKGKEGPRKIIEVPAKDGQPPEVFFIDYQAGENRLLPGDIYLQDALKYARDIDGTKTTGPNTGYNNGANQYVGYSDGNQNGDILNSDYPLGDIQNNVNQNSAHTSPIRQNGGTQNYDQSPPPNQNGNSQNYLYPPFTNQNRGNQNSDNTSPTGGNGGNQYNGSPSQYIEVKSDPSSWHPSVNNRKRVRQHSFIAPHYG